MQRQDTPWFFRHKRPRDKSNGSENIPGDVVRRGRRVLNWIEAIIFFYCPSRVLASFEFLESRVKSRQRNVCILYKQPILLSGKNASTAEAAHPPLWASSSQICSDCGKAESEKNSFQKTVDFSDHRIVISL
jgi:hypothetical protein